MFGSLGRIFRRRSQRPLPPSTRKIVPPVDCAKQEETIPDDSVESGSLSARPRLELAPLDVERTLFQSAQADVKVPLTPHGAKGNRVKKGSVIKASAATCDITQVSTIRSDVAEPLTKSTSTFSTFSETPPDTTHPSDEEYEGRSDPDRRSETPFEKTMRLAGDAPHPLSSSNTTQGHAIREYTVLECLKSTASNDSNCYGMKPEEVFVARHPRLPDQKVIIKSRPLFVKGIVSPYRKTLAIRETSVLRTLSDPQLMDMIGWCNVIKYVDHITIFLSNEHFLITEYCRLGTLLDYLRDYKDIAHTLRSHIAYDVVSGMAYIHYLEIAHRDMKLENIVLTSGPGGRVVAKIADFGFSHSALEHTRDDVRCGSPDYAGPEIIINCQDSMFPSDIWALGIIIYSIYEVRWPYVEKNLKQKLVGHQTLDSMTWKDELDIPYVVMSRDAPFQFLINSMLRMLPETRPKAVHIAGDYFFTRMSSQTAPVASSF